MTVPCVLTTNVSDLLERLSTYVVSADNKPSWHTTTQPGKVTIYVATKYTKSQVLTYNINRSTRAERGATEHAKLQKASTTDAEAIVGIENVQRCPFPQSTRGLEEHRKFPPPRGVQGPQTYIGAF